MMNRKLALATCIAAALAIPAAFATDTAPAAPATVIRGHEADPPATPAVPAAGTADAATPAVPAEATAGEPADRAATPAAQPEGTATADAVAANTDPSGKPTSRHKRKPKNDPTGK